MVQNSLKNKTTALQSLSDNEPLIGVLCCKGILWVLHQPFAGHQMGRSAFTASRLVVDDSKGFSVHDMCWFAPIELGEEQQHFKSVHDLMPSVKEHILFLPSPPKPEMEAYYCQKQSGHFQPATVVENLFKEWMPHSGQSEEDDDDVSLDVKVADV